MPFLNVRIAEPGRRIQYFGHRPGALRPIKFIGASCKWMLARQQARRDVKKEHLQIRLRSGTHIVHKPRDGRLFLISDLDPMKLARRYRLWAWFHLLVLFGSAGGMAWVMTWSA